ncbi:MAG: hypothetical protein ABIF01_05330, partial [Candidatus Micrarchaeota archaeon]
MRGILFVLALLALSMSAFALSADVQIDELNERASTTANFKTYINDYIDKYTEDRVTAPYGLNNCSDTEIKPCFDQMPTLGFLTITSAEIADPLTGCAHGKRIDQTAFSPLADFAITTQSGTVTETQTIWAHGSTVYDETLQTVVSPSPNVAYKIDFRQSGNSFGLPQSWANVSTIKFLGSNWRVLSMSAPSMTGFNPAIHFGVSGTAGSISLLNLETGQTLTLSHGQLIANNPTWYAYLYWVPDQSGMPTLKTVVLRRDPNDASVILLKLSTGGSINIISSPNKFRFTYEGLNLAPADYDTLGVSVTGLTSLTFGYGDCTIVNSTGPHRFLLLNTSTPNAFTIDGAPVSYFFVDLDGIYSTYTNAYYQQAGQSCFFVKPLQPGMTIATYNLGDGGAQRIVLGSTYFMGGNGTGNLTLGLYEMTSAQQGIEEALLVTAMKPSGMPWEFYGYQTQAKIRYMRSAMFGGPAGYPPVKFVDTGFVSERGTVFSSHSSTYAMFMVAKRVAEATYSVSTVGPICGDGVC